MNRFTKYISSQFGNPRGLAGRIICTIQNIVNSAMYKKTVFLVELQSGDKFLDIGYGNGHLMKLVYKKKPVDMYGIDISDDAKAMAVKKNKKADQAKQLHLQVGDCCDLPYEEGVFSAVTSINTIYFWSDPVKGLSEIRRTLKYGKSFYNVVYTKEYLDKIKYTQTGYKKFEPEQLIEFGKEAGYTNIEIIDIIKTKNYIIAYTK